MVSSALPKSRSHAPVTNSELNARGRDLGPQQVTKKVMTLRSLREDDGNLATSDHSSGLKFATEEDGCDHTRSGKTLAGFQGFPPDCSECEGGHATHSPCAAFLSGGRIGQSTWRACRLGNGKLIQALVVAPRRCAVMLSASS
jgi:hypothetical protein